MNKRTGIKLTTVSMLSLSAILLTSCSQPDNQAAPSTERVASVQQAEDSNTFEDTYLWGDNESTLEDNNSHENNSTSEESENPETPEIEDESSVNDSFTDDSSDDYDNELQTQDQDQNNGGSDSSISANTRTSNTSHGDTHNDSAHDQLQDHNIGSSQSRQATQNSERNNGTVSQSQSNTGQGTQQQEKQGMKQSQSQSGGGQQSQSQSQTIDWGSFGDNIRISDNASGKDSNMRSSGSDSHRSQGNLSRDGLGFANISQRQSQDQNNGSGDDFLDNPVTTSPTTTTPTTPTSNPSESVTGESYYDPYYPEDYDGEGNVIENINTNDTGNMENIGEYVADFVINNGNAIITRVNVEPGTIDYTPLDELGRAVMAYGVLTKDLYEKEKNEEREPIDVDPAGWSKNEEVTITNGNDTYHGWLFNRSHLIADSLGGDAVKENLITGTRMQNVGWNDHLGGMGYIEDSVRNFLENTDPSCHVEYQVMPVYDGDDLVPKHIKVDVKSCDSTLDNSYIVENVAPGFTINYRDGSWSKEETAQ